MIDFILAAALYLAVMFSVVFCISFVVVGTTYAVAMGVSWLVSLFREPEYGLK